MITLHTASMEVFAPKANGSFALEPFECGWAMEALAMIYVREIHGPAPQLTLRVEISADGCRWMPHPVKQLSVAETGGYHLAVTQFGNWLRLCGEISGGPDDGTPALFADFYWVLKG
jgi:hypothetical protein